MSLRYRRFLMRERHGVLVGLPIEQALARDDLLAQLPPEEAALAATWGDARVRTFVAGRLALRAALEELGAEVRGPILRTARGAPVLPPGVRASVSHKDEVAVALVAERVAGDDASHVGVDVELLSPPRSDVSRHVLTDAERAELAPLDEEARRRALLVRFSLKEALYKALDPFVQRYVGFLEVEARPLDDGGAAFQLDLAEGALAFHAEGRWLVQGDVVLTTARVRRRT
jgi:enterobactin synthetase component D